MPNIRGRDLMRIALRASALQATWNYERQQGLGWAWALKPALDRVYPDPERRRERLAEHTAFFNTQPTLASLALGAVAGMEEVRATGAGPDAGAVARVKTVLASSLAALGDRLFWFTLRPFAACLGVVLAVGGSRFGAVALWLCYNLIHQTVRWQGVRWGYRQGPAVMGGELRRGFERLTYVLSLAGTALVGVLVAVLLATGGGTRPVLFEVLLAIGLGFGLVTAQHPRPSPTAWALGLGAIAVAVTWVR